MGLILVAILLTVFIGIKYRKHDNIDSYLDKDYTTSIIGIFAVLIFFKHFYNYLDYSTLNSLDMISAYINRGLGQLVVVPFMFFSGYGILEQIKKRGDKYVNTIPKGRALKVYLMFLLAWIPYFVLIFILPPIYSYQHVLWSVIGFTKIGNSNWYVVIIIALYLSTYVSFKCISNRRDALIVNVLLAVLIMFILKNVGMESYWYDTIPAYAFGLIYSYNKDKIVLLYKTHKASRWIMFAASIASTVLFGMLNILDNNIFFFSMMVISFCMIFACFLSLFAVKNKIVLTLGKYCFWIFVIHRFTMKVFYNVPAIVKNNYVYLLVCMVSTAVLAFALEKLFSVIWKLLNKKKA